MRRRHRGEEVLVGRMTTKKNSANNGVATTNSLGTWSGTFAAVKEEMKATDVNPMCPLEIMNIGSFGEDDPRRRSNQEVLHFMWATEVATHQGVAQLELPLRLSTVRVVPPLRLFKKGLTFPVEAQNPLMSWSPQGRNAIRLSREKLMTMSAMRGRLQRGIHGARRLRALFRRIFHSHVQQLAALIRGYLVNQLVLCMATIKNGEPVLQGGWWGTKKARRRCSIHSPQTYGGNRRRTSCPRRKWNGTMWR
jgi:hypothetical protein